MQFRSLRARLTFYTLVICTVVFCSAWYLFYTYSATREKEMAMENTISQLQNALHHADQHLERLEVAAQLFATDIEDLQNDRQRQNVYMDEFLYYDSLIKGAGLYYEPTYEKHRGAYSYYYAFKSDADSITRTSWHSTEYDFDYTVEHWYSEALKHNRSLWSEPYHEEDGNRIITTYSVPIHDNEGKVFAVMLIDIGLRHFTHIVDRVKLRDDSRLFMLSREGQVLTYHQMSPQVNYDLVDYVKKRDNVDLQPVVDDMLKGNSGAMVVDGNKKYIAFYTSLPEKGWSLCNLCSYDDIMKPVEQMIWGVLAISIVGIAVLLLCIRILFRHQMRPVDTMESDLRLARELQMKLLPDAAPTFADHKDLDLYATLTPAHEVGGDLYDYLVRDGRLYFIVGDVSGKGVPAAIFMSMTDIVFRSAARNFDSPAEIVGNINNALVDKNETMMFVTCFVGILDLNTGRLQYCNAGHTPPLIVKDNGEAEYIKLNTNLSAGIIRNFPFESQELMLAGDALIVYTDGVTEACNKRHELFGEVRLKETAETVAENVQGIVKRIVAGVQTFVNDAPPSDDLTMLCVRLDRQDTPAGQEPISASLTLTNKIVEIKKLTAFIDLLTDTGTIPASQTMKLHLALEEAVVNVINYAYPKGEEGDIALTAEYNPLTTEWRFTLVDHGTPFDPTAAPDTDPTLSLDERPIGGLGIFLIKQLMDSVDYAYEHGENRLVMKKRFTQL